MPDERGPEVSAGEIGMFLLEIVGLIGVGRLGWTLGSSLVWSLALSALFVAVASAVWVLFRTRGFVPSGGDPIVAVPGPVRLVIEYAFYATATWGLWISGWPFAAAVFAAGVLLVSVALRDRIAGLLAGGNEPRRGARG